MCVSSRTSRRRGAAAKILLAGVATVAILGGLWAAMNDRSGSGVGGSGEPLVCYVAASNRPVFEAIRQDYEREYGVPLQVQYGPSQTLLATAETSKTGDLYLPADDGYLDTAREKQLSAEVFPLAEMQAVIGVKKGNPKGIAKWDDLFRDDVRVALSSPDSAAIGKLTRTALTKSGLWEALNKQKTVEHATITEVANSISLDGADAGIVFDSMLHDFDKLDAVSVPELREVHAQVAAAVLTTSQQPTRALHFARYLSARDKGLARYKEFGFVPADGDAWSDVPEVTLYAGSMLRPAIEQTITKFEAREGVKVTRSYNGCGILVGQMRAGQVPDAYFACDVEFMKQVHDLFPEAEDVSQNELVILVKKGNPLGITSLADLGKTEMRVGIGHEKQCAMGWLTQRTFREGGVQDAVMKNVKVEVPAGDMLVNQMLAGSLDAAVVYLSNAAGAADELDAVRIQGLPCSVATQPYAAAKDSRNRRTMERLLAAIRAADSQQRFGAEGFRWIDAKPAP